MERAAASLRSFMEHHRLNPDDKDLAVTLLNLLDERDGSNKPYWDAASDLHAMDWKRIERALKGSRSFKIEGWIQQVRDDAELRIKDAVVDEGPGYVHVNRPLNEHMADIIAVAEIDRQARADAEGAALSGTLIDVEQPSGNLGAFSR